MWYYYMYNYYLNVIILFWMEVVYICILFKVEVFGLKFYGYLGFMNQDWYFFFRLWVLKEG